MKSFVLFISMLYGLCGFSQQPDIVFHHLTQNDGLSYNLVNCFLKDSRGILWIGTSNGLNRYDGAHFYTYHSGHAKNTLPSNSVHKLAEDKNGNIWGGTDNGVFCLDIKSGLFKNYRTPLQERRPVVYNICCDAEGRIWVANNFCLSVFNALADSFEMPSTSNGFNFQGIIGKNSLAESPDGKGMWLATRNGIVYYSKTERKYFFGKEGGDSNTIFNNHPASALCKTPFGHYWYVDNKTKTIIGFNPISRQIIYRLKVDNTASVADGATLYEDDTHQLWFCNWRYELYKIDYNNGLYVKRIKHNKDDITSIAGDFFWDVMQEKDGTLWFGTVAGISKCNMARSFYKVHKMPVEWNDMDNPAIECLAENPFDKTWWFVTRKNILIQYNPVTNNIVKYELDKFLPNKKNLTPYHTNRLIFVKDSIFLFGYGGVWLKRGSNKFLPVDYPPPYDKFSTTDAVQYDMNTIYGITAHKMLRWNLLNNSFDSIVFPNPFYIKGFPARIGQPRIVNNKVWVLSTNNWLVYAEDNRLKAIRMNYQDSTEQDDGYFTNMIVDQKGDLWMSKKGDGLIYFNPRNKVSKQYKQADGLVMDHIMAVANDVSGRIWSACFNQFSVYNPSLNSFSNFTLPLSTNNNGYINFMSTLQNGNIIANIAGDLVEFFPSKLKAPRVDDQPIISMIYINGMAQYVNGEKQFQLKADENSLRIRFGMLADNVSAPYDMQYLMEGAESKWNQSAGYFEANYNSLPAGNYTFKVKAVAKDRSWQTKETILSVSIATPYYKSWWFLLLTIIAIISAIVMIYRVQIGQKEKVMILKTKAQHLEKEKAMVMYENLRQQLNPHFLFNSLTSLSGLIELDQEIAGRFLDQMSGIYRYILKSGDHETVSLREEIEFVKLYINLQQTRFKQGLQILINIPEEFEHYKIAPITLQNMIENAIKHNVVDAETPLIVQIFIEGGYIVIKNNLQKKNKVETSNKKGLNQFVSLYKYLSDHPVIVGDNDLFFVVKIPLI